LTSAQLRQADVLPIRLYFADQPPVDIPFVPFHDDRLTEGELCQALAGCLVVRLFTLRGINIGAVHGPLVLHVDSQRANAIQNKARREIEALAEPSKGLHEKVLLRWYQARGVAESKAGDRAIIESISSLPVKTICANDVIKMQMILEEGNPFREAYIVDVMVDTIRGKPALYKILAIHDKFEPTDS